MLAALGLKKLDELFAHIPEQVRFAEAPPIAEELSYESLIQHVQELSAKNILPQSSFLGDGLPNFEPTALGKEVLGLRELTTAYTPYQPERSQGTLMTHWIYQCAMAQLTDFEAINVSMYDRSTTLFEAILTALRLSSNKNTALIASDIYPGDLEVLETLICETSTKIQVLACGEDGQANISALEAALKSNSDIGVLVFPQINRFGVLEDVDTLTNLAHAHGLKALALVDPMLLATGGLKAPANYGQNGADIFVAEGQHLAIGPNCGGPGLGVFGIRFNETHRNEIRSTPGRFVGSALDLEGRVCKVQVISTREQHIRREKATSNICSNQAYIATVAGASILARGEIGMSASCAKARNNATLALGKILKAKGVRLAFGTRFFNEFCLELPTVCSQLITKALERQIHLGADVSRQGKHLLKLSFNDRQSEKDLDALAQFFVSQFGVEHADQALNLDLKLEPAFLRRTPVGLPDFSQAELKAFYKGLATQNISPDNVIYPLGSCTMKYNPYINDYAAGLPGFAESHPQAPPEALQGSLEILYHTQNDFSTILGLAGLTTQPVAGAQGEWAGLKMIQAYHRDRGEHRDIVLIPRSAHGTNPATATMAGFTTSTRKGELSGVVLIEADERGLVDIQHLDSLLAQFGPRVAAIMVTNPNTSGLFERDFALIAEKIHAVGGLVYMDGANLNAIAGWVNLGALGVDAVHSNTHKTWSIPHGGGGPGDAFVAVSEKLLDFLPGIQVVKKGDRFVITKAPKSIGSFHRHFGNFGHKIRCYTYLKRLGRQGVRRMSAVAVLSARYLQWRFAKHFEILPVRKGNQPCMHEFILGLPESLFESIIKSGIPKASVISRVGKLFLDYGFHAPTVAFPEVYGIMVEPTESYSKAELDRFVDAVLEIRRMIEKHPEVLQTVPHFTPVDRVDDVTANRQLILSEPLKTLPEILNNRVTPQDLGAMNVKDISKRILAAHRESLAPALA
jgi:glycine dehydrogenase